VSIGVGLCVWLLWRLRLPCLGLNGVVWREFFLFLFSVPCVKSCMSLVVLFVFSGVPPRVPLGVRIMILRDGVLFWFWVVVVDRSALLCGCALGMCTFVWFNCGAPPGDPGGTGWTWGKEGIVGSDVKVCVSWLVVSGVSDSASALVLLGVVCSPGDDMLRLPVMLVVASVFVGWLVPPSTCVGCVGLFSAWPPCGGHGVGPAVWMCGVGGA
jgi:hypothetical protein